MAEWGLALSPSGTQTKQTRTHTSRDRPPPSGGPHRTPEPHTHRKRRLPPCARTSPWSVGTCESPLPPRAAHPRRSLTTHRGGASDTPSRARPSPPLLSSRGPRPRGRLSRDLSAHPGRLAHERRSAQPSSLRALGEGRGLRGSYWRN